MNTPLDTNYNEVNTIVNAKDPIYSQNQSNESTSQRINEFEANLKKLKNKASNANNTNLASRSESEGQASDGQKESAMDNWNPVKSIREIPPGRAYPVEALPTIMREAVEETHAYVQAPVALIANSALACLAASCQSLINVCRDDALISPISLFILTLAESGERKTTCDSFFSQPVKETQKKLQLDMAPQVAEFKADMASWEPRVEGIQAGIKRLSSASKGENTSELETMKANLALALESKPVAPKIPLILRTDDTPENLCYALMHDWPSVGIISSEGGQVFSSRALNKDNIGNTLAMYNTFWDGGSWHIGRKTSGSYTVEGARLTMGIQLQPRVLDQFLESGNNLARQIGFIARCLFSYPESTQGNRLYKDPPKSPKLASFNDVVRKLLGIEPNFEAGVLKPENISLSKDAHEIWRSFHDDCELQLGLKGKYATIRDVTSKIADNAARVAALFAVLKGFPINEVDSDSMKRATAIVRWHLDEALRYFGEDQALFELMSEARKLEEWLIKHKNTKSRIPIAKTLIMQLGPNSLRTARDLDKVVKFLIERNRVRLTLDLKQLEINPELLSK